MTCAGCEDCPFDGSSINKDGDNYPFELHITVSAKSDIEQFKRDCADLGVKPILIDLQTQDGSVMFDLMTSSTVTGSYQHALNTSFLLAADFAWMGYEVLRRKIETVPWHPAADNMTDGQYFEAHIPVETPWNRVTDLSNLAKGSGAHRSQNVFKRSPDGIPTFMLTVRAAGCPLSYFLNKMVGRVTERLSIEGFAFPRIITEFAIFDDKTDHDLLWTK